MKTAYILVFSLLFFHLFSQEIPNIHNVPYIEVTGEGKLEIIPDEIYLSITIDEGDRGRQSMEKQERDMLKQLESIGVDSKSQLKVLDFNSGFKTRIIGQKINTAKSYQLLLRQTKRVPQVFAELEKVGISNITLLRVDHSEIEAYELEVKMLAIRSAKQKAEKMLSELGHSVGKPLYIQERNVGFGRQNDYMARGVASFAESEALPDLDFQTIVLQYGVQVRFSID